MMKILRITDDFDAETDQGTFKVVEVVATLVNEWDQQAEQIRELETRNNALMCIGVKKEEQYKSENQRLKELLFACYDDVSQAMQAKIDKERNGQ